MREFKGRIVTPGTVTAEAVVTHGGLNTLASFQKALLFGDREVYDEIMAAESPDKYKKLGRKVRNFDSKVWDEKKYDIVVEGNKAKFSQNPVLMEFLLSTGDAILVEASPYDTIWGIGLDIETAKKGSVEDWKGENLLGCALMETRDWLQEK